MTDKQAEAVAAAIRAAQALASVGSGVRPTTNIVEFLSGFEGQEPQCPVVEVTTIEGAMNVTLSHGESCTSILYPDVTLSGTIEGIVNALEQTLSLTFDDYGANGDSVDGSVAAGFGSGGSASAMDAAVDLSVAGVANVEGTMVASADLQNGLVTILAAALSVTIDAGTFTVMMDDLVVDPAQTGSFVPQSGVMILEVQPEAEDGETVSINVEFTERSPDGGTILLAVDGGFQTSYSFK